MPVEVGVADGDWVGLAVPVLVTVFTAVSLAVNVSVPVFIRSGVNVTVAV